jgi:hypothetical protein
MNRQDAPCRRSDGGPSGVSGEARIVRETNKPIAQVAADCVGRNQGVKHQPKHDKSGPRVLRNLALWDQGAPPGGALSVAPRAGSAPGSIAAHGRLPLRSRRPGRAAQHPAKDTTARRPAAHQDPTDRSRQQHRSAPVATS